MALELFSLHRLMAVWAGEIPGPNYENFIRGIRGRAKITQAPSGRLRRRPGPTEETVSHKLAEVKCWMYRL